MRRRTNTPRPAWQQRVTDAGLIFHDAGGAYWREDAFYEFSSHEINEIEAATNELYARCLDAVDHVIANRRYAEFHIPEAAIPLIEASWHEEWPSIYGRFDLAYGERGMPPKMLEFNGDTPTSLLEAAVIQWHWLEDMIALRHFRSADQFNSIHERLIAQWKEITGSLINSPRLHFASIDDSEDWMTTTYLLDTASQAGLPVKFVRIDNIAWVEDALGGEFRDGDGEPIANIFKLYPWEWMLAEDFGRFLPLTFRDTRWIEPNWKMILSNKAILAVLWELFPHHPNLLPAYLDDPRNMRDFVKKPLISREGQNVTVNVRGATVESAGEYGEEGFVYQQFAPIPSFDGWTPVLGSWIIGVEAGGMGIRETQGLITGNTSRFAPHAFDLRL